MAATKLDGTAIAKSIRERLAKDIAAKQQSNPRFKPSLKIIQGIFTCSFEGQQRRPTANSYPLQSAIVLILVSDPACCGQLDTARLTNLFPFLATYVRMKLKAAQEVRFPIPSLSLRDPQFATDP